MRPGSTHFQLGSPPVTAAGIEVSEQVLRDELAGPTAALVFDQNGTASLGHLLEGLSDTQFARGNLEALLADSSAPEDWRVGEALAERYLAENRDCFFPWPDGRDERKRGSSLPGADLVGFRQSAGQDRFAFGEVKTTSDETRPPGPVYGRHGLKQQMEDLRDNREVKDALVRYLGHRAHNATWQSRYRTAAQAYLNDTGDVHLFGMLVRDVAPHEDDLRARATKLRSGCPTATVIELVALYLPLGSIATLSAKVVASQQQGGGP